MERGGVVERAGTGPMRCALIGADSLLVECGEILRARGHHVVVVAAGSAKVASWARGHDVPVVDLADSPSGAWVTELTSHDVEVLFSITHLAMLPAEVLDWPTVAAVNFHDGPLPAFAGLNAPMWALLRGASTYGISWHLITAGVDEGDLLARATFEVAPGETALSLNTRNFERAIDTFGPLVDDLAAGRATRMPQDPSEGREVFRRRDRPDALCCLDWRQAAVEVDRLVRALDVGPYPNPLGRATVLHGGRAMAVTHSEVRPADRGVPGEVLDVSADAVLVRCGRDAVALRGFTTLDGGVVPVEAAAAEMGWTVGQRLDLLDDARREELTELGQRLAPHEPVHLERLRRLEPVTLPWAATAGPNHVARAATVPVEVPMACRERYDDPAPAIVAGFAAVVARLSGRSVVHLAAADASVAADVVRAAPLVSPWVPLPIEIDTATSFAAAVTTASSALAELAAGGSMLADLVAREPDLTRRAAAGTLVPALGLRLDGGGDLVPGVAAELARDGDEWMLRYDAGLISADDARLGVDCLTTLLAASASDPDMVVAEVDLLGTEVRHQVLERWNDTVGAVRTDACIHHLFEEQVDRTPDTVAAVFEDRTLTYAELDARADQLAAHLRELGVVPDALVGVHVERGLELLVAVLGVLKAGGAYVPLDPTYPDDRLRHMIADSGASVVLTLEHLEAVLPLPPGSDVRVVRVDADRPSIERHAPTRLRAATGPEHLAYCIYTSGSTGLPKGVLVEHRNVVSFFHGMDACVDHELPATWFAVTSLSFDISVLELLYTLARGFTVVVHLDRERAGDDGTDRAAPVDARSIDFSLFYFNGDEAEHTGPDKYRLLLEGARWADQHGFSAVWTPERHFHAFGGLYPQPAVTAAAIAAVTERVSIRAGSVVLPLNHPIRVAEEWSVVDNLSNGRVGLGIASGWHPDDFVLMPEGYADAKQRMFHDIDVVRRLWRGEELSFPGPGGREPVVRTLPRPVQPEVPIWVTTAGNPETYRQAGAIGANLLTHLLGQSVEQLAPKIAAYRQARADAGHDPATGIVTVMLHTFVGDDEDEVRELVRGPLKAYLGTAVSLVKDDAWVFPAFKRPEGAPPPDGNELAHLSADEVDTILEYGFLRYYETSGLFGTPDRAMRMVERMKAIGVDDIACLIDFGISSETVLAHLRHLGELHRRANEVVRIHEAPAHDQSVAAQLRRHEVTHLQCTPSMARMFTLQDDTRAALAGVEHVYVGGEAFPASLAQDLVGLVRSGDVTNMYGPTETTIWSTTWKLDRRLASVPIGNPIANTRVYVLDQHLEPLPPGVAGELWIGGEGVVRGYHRRPELTAERFVTDPFRGGGARMYRTGDLARWRRRGDGSAVLEFLGRIDHQVKIRGYRIELGEIETRLGQHPAVRECVVVVRADAAGDGELVAFVSARAGTGASPADLKEHLRVTLPPPMVPAHVVVLDDLPHTPNGKIDRNALPGPGAVAARGAGAPAAAENDLERVVLEAWHQTLASTSIGVDDNFFDVGGHSLLVVRLQRRLNEVLSSPVALTDLYRHPTVRSFVSSLADDGSASGAQQGLDRAARRRESLMRRRAR